MFAQLSTYSTITILAENTSALELWAYSGSNSHHDYLLNIAEWLGGMERQVLQNAPTGISASASMPSHPSAAAGNPGIQTEALLHHKGILTAAVAATATVSSDISEQQMRNLGHEHISRHLGVERHQHALNDANLRSTNVAAAATEHMVNRIGHLGNFSARSSRTKHTQVQPRTQVHVQSDISAQVQVY